MANQKFFGKNKANTIFNKSIWLTALIAILVFLNIVFLHIPNFKAEAFSGGDGSVGNPYIIMTESDLTALSGSSSYLGSSFVLGADITVSGAWTPIGTEASPFTGNFNGNGHTITFSSALDMTGSTCYGFIAYATANTNMTIKNLTINYASGATNTDADSATFVFGGIVGVVNNSSQFTMSYCSVKGTCIDVKRGLSVGGLIGELNNNLGTTELTYCQNNIKCSMGMSAYDESANLAGIVATVNLSAGILNIKRSFNKGVVFGDPGDSTIFAGGIIANVSENVGKVVIDKCFNDVETNEDYGILAYGYFDGGEVGGILGRGKGVIEISNSYNLSGVRGGGYKGGGDVGGIVGRGEDSTMTIKNCYNTGEISGQVISGGGGIFGYLSSGQANLYNCFSLAKVSLSVYMSESDSKGGGIAGSSSVNVFSCYYDSSMPNSSNITTAIYNVSDTSTCKGVANLSSSMKNVSTYTGSSVVSWDSTYPWDFDSVWAIKNDGTDLPILRAFQEYSLTYSSGEGQTKVVNFVGEMTVALATASECGFTKNGYFLSKWTDGTNYYECGQELTLNDNLTLTAVWQVSNRTLTFKINTTRDVIMGMTITNKATSESKFVSWAINAGENVYIMELNGGVNYEILFHLPYLGVLSFSNLENANYNLNSRTLTFTLVSDSTFNGTLTLVSGLNHGICI